MLKETQTEVTEVFLCDIFIIGIILIRGSGPLAPLLATTTGGRLGFCSAGLTFVMSLIKRKGCS